MKFFLLFAFIGITVAAPSARNLTTFIINGEEIGIHQALYHVSIQNKAGSHLCGGTIINKEYVLTTAECAQGLTPATHQILYGTEDLTWGGFKEEITNVYIHPQYTAGQLSYNIALIRIRGYFSSYNYNNVALRCPDAEVDKEDLLVAGWGWIRDQSGQLTMQLHQVTLPYAGNTCARYYSTIGKVVDERTFCAGDLDRGGAGICEGDKGGAAVKVSKSGVRMVTGIASYYSQCGAPKLISLFTRVGSYYNWIRNIVGTNNINCSY